MAAFPFTFNLRGDVDRTRVTVIADDDKGRSRRTGKKTATVERSCAEPFLIQRVNVRDDRGPL